MLLVNIRECLPRKGKGLVPGMHPAVRVSSRHFRSVFYRVQHFNIGRSYTISEGLTLRRISDDCATKGCITVMVPVPVPVKIYL